METALNITGYSSQDKANMARDTSPISESAACALAETPRDEWADVVAEAGRMEADTSRPVSVSRNIFMPLTRVCRDYCGYCTFRRDEGDADDGVMSLDEVRALVRAGKEAGCTEVLISLGDKPEEVSGKVRAFLASRGHSSIIDYVIEACEVVLEEGLLPHANPGLMSGEVLARLKSVTASQGMMLESVSGDLFSKGSAHYKCPDKVVSQRLKCLDDAGIERVPFTTGLLIGIGETMLDRADTLLAIRDTHACHGHIQEVIVQNFKPKDDIPMRDMAPVSFDEFQFVVALARLILGPDMNVQAPPNLTEVRFGELLNAGINDWGGVSPLTVDHINPEAPWPQLDELTRQTNSRGKELRERLTIYPEYIISNGSEFIHPDMLGAIEVLAGDDGFRK